MGKKFKITVVLIDLEASDIEDLDIQKKALKNIIGEELSNYDFDVESIDVEQVSI